VEEDFQMGVQHIVETGRPSREEHPSQAGHPSEAEPGMQSLDPSSRHQDIHRSRSQAGHREVEEGVPAVATAPSCLAVHCIQRFADRIHNHHRHDWPRERQTLDYHHSRHEERRGRHVPRVLQLQ
jgi:hypothetical protein